MNDAGPSLVASLTAAAGAMGVVHVCYAVMERRSHSNERGDTRDTRHDPRHTPHTALVARYCWRMGGMHGSTGRLVHSANCTLLLADGRHAWRYRPFAYARCHVSAVTLRARG